MKPFEFIISESFGPKDPEYLIQLVYGDASNGIWYYNCKEIEIIYP